MASLLSLPSGGLGLEYDSAASIAPQPTTQTAPASCAWWQDVLYGCSLNPGTTTVPSAGPGGLSVQGVYGAPAGSGAATQAQIFGVSPSGATGTVPGAFTVGGLDSSSTGTAGSSTSNQTLAELQYWLANDAGPAVIWTVAGLLLLAFGLWAIIKEA